MEKSKRKIEGDLRVSQEAVVELERSKAELAQACANDSTVKMKIVIESKSMKGALMVLLINSQ